MPRGLRLIAYVIGSGVSFSFYGNHGAIEGFQSLKWAEMGKITIFDLDLQDHHCTVVSERGEEKKFCFLQIFSDHEM